MKTSIDVGYPSNLLYRDVKLEIPNNGILSFVGDNGSGKSTLFKTLTGLQKTIRGSVPSELVTKSFVISDYIHIPDEIKVRDILTLLDPDQYLETERSYNSVYKYVEKLKNRKIKMLSSGERKIIEIFSALAVNKKYLFLDEALSSLDYANKNIVLEIIKDIAQADITIFYISHNLDEIIELQGDIYCLLPDQKEIIKLAEDQKNMVAIKALIQGRNHEKTY